MSPISDRLEALAELYGRNPLDVLEWWLERAAIREYDAGMTRRNAEQLALRDVENELAGSHSNRGAR
jgi:hypothetical protein